MQKYSPFISLFTLLTFANDVMIFQKFVLYLSIIRVSQKVMGENLVLQQEMISYILVFLSRP